MLALSHQNPMLVLGEIPGRRFKDVTALVHGS